ncbi:hypothetical protein [Streptomyces sp. NPDC006335]|uniref:hypothetical protein n=1 Tax=Streptomyces sp. NPDC006335 TaxID=3156895 RepID=UPI0033ADE2DC
MSEFQWNPLPAAELRALPVRDAVVLLPVWATEQHRPPSAHRRRRLPGGGGVPPSGGTATHPEPIRDGHLPEVHGPRITLPAESTDPVHMAVLLHRVSPNRHSSPP